MFKLEDSIKKWLRQFQKQQAFDEGAIREMEDHLRDHIEDLIDQGLSDEDAFQQAVASFGEVPKMADEEFKNIKRKTSLRTILFATMLNNFFKTSTRNLLKNPMTTFINVFGLAVAIGACMVTFAFIDHDLSIDLHHENKDELFLSLYNVNREGQEQLYGDSPKPLADRLRADFPMIKNVTQIKDANAILKFDEQVFHESIRYVDPEFLEMFSFPLKWGVASSLQDVNSVILSEESAKKYFGDQNPIGQDIKVIINEDISKFFKVAGVAKKFPDACIIEFDVLMNIENLEQFYPDHDASDWTQKVQATFIQVENPADLALIKAEMDPYKALQNEVESDWPISSFDFIGLHDLHLASDEIRNDISYDASDEGRVGLPFISGFLLLLACFNYLNIAIVSATKRLKEIGMRKVIGAGKGMIIYQFLIENLFMTFLAAMLGLILAITIFLPWFSTFAGITDSFNLLDPNMWLVLGIILIATGILSGIYPAFYISRFPAVQIFKGSLKFGKSNLVTKVFLTGQLILTCSGIGFALMFAQNSDYQSKRDWGYNQKQLLYVRLNNADTFQKFADALEQSSLVASVAGSYDHLSVKRQTSVIELPEKKFEVAELSVGSNYAETVGLEILQGRFFEEDSQTDLQSIVVNELLLENLGISDPLNLPVKIDSATYRIVGVVKDFHFRNFYGLKRPTIFTLSNEDQFDFITMKVQDGAQAEGYKLLQDQWSSIFPELPFNGGFQEDTWIEFYTDLNTMQRFSRSISMVFVVLAVLGLYGLIQLNIAGRIREFSIRKTLGARASNLAMSLSKQYILFFTVSIILGIPIGHMLNTAMLDMMFPEPRPFGYSGAIAAGILLVFVLALVIFAQVRRVSKINPVDGLKVE